MISDKSQDSVAARLRCGELFSYHLTMYLSPSLVTNEFKTDEHLAKLQVKKVDCLVCPVRFSVILLKDEQLVR